jgi:hypothetical protein
VLAAVPALGFVRGPLVGAGELSVEPLRWVLTAEDDDAEVAAPELCPLAVLAESRTEPVLPRRENSLTRSVRTSSFGSPLSFSAVA